MRYHRRGVRRGFRRKQRVNWLPTNKSGPLGREFTAGIAGVQEYPLVSADNAFVTTNTRFATANDVMTIKRVLGTLRIGWYPDTSELTADVQPDLVVDYGLCLVKGEYDGTGTWSAPEATVPNPADTVDDPDKWLFRNEIIFNRGSWLAGNFGPSLTTPPQYYQSNMFRQPMLTTDLQLPNGSMIDIKPNRRALFEEKLCIVVTINSSDPDLPGAVYINDNLRVLTAKWG